MNSIYSILILFFLFSCNRSNDDNKLIVATAADNPPYEFIYNNEIVGFDIDLAYAIGKKLNKKVVIKNFEFNTLFGALNSNSVSMIIAGLSKTPEREKHVVFSIPYLSSKDASAISLLYRGADNFFKISDLENKVIGVQLGTIWAKLIENLAQQYSINIKYLSNNLILVEELKSRGVDAIVLEELQCKKFVKNFSELNYFILDHGSYDFSIVLPKNSEYISNINQAILDLKNDGTIDKISSKWLTE